MTDNKHKQLEKVYEELWEGRNIEIKNLWQRCVFLLTLISLFLTAYGSLWGHILDSNYPFSVENFRFVNLIFCFISVCGICFCCIWVRMAQAAKYHVERYERAINEFYNQSGINKEKYPFHGNYKEPYHVVEGRWFKTIFTTSGTRYSPSKLNVAIGQIVGLLFCTLLLFHLLSIIGSLKFKELFDSLDARAVYSQVVVGFFEEIISTENIIQKTSILSAFYQIMVKMKWCNLVILFPFFFFLFIEWIVCSRQKTYWLKSGNKKNEDSDKNK